MVYTPVRDFLPTRLTVLCFCLSRPSMTSDRNSSHDDGGHATERQPLLQSPLSVNDRPDADTAIDTEDVAAGNPEINTLQVSRSKLSASALNFFLSGIAMAAVGVSIVAHAYTSKAR
jgi:hypothetical protein